MGRRLTGWIDLLAGATGRFSRDRGSQAAAAVAYFCLVSLFPLLIFVAGVFAVVLQSGAFKSRVLAALLAYVPGEQTQLRTLLAAALDRVTAAHGLALGAVGLLGMAWTASSLFGQIRTALDVAFQGGNLRPPVQQKLMDLGLVIVSGAFLVASWAVTALVQISGALPLLAFVPRAAWQWVGIVLSFLLVLAAFYFLYRVVPARRPRRRVALAAAVLAAIVFQAADLLFSLYLSNFGRYDVIYGSVGALVAFLAWVYLGALILIFGAEVAAESQARSGRQGPSAEGGEAPQAMSLRRFLRSLVVTERR